VGKTRIIPAKNFEHEQPFLRKLPVYITPPYIAHERGIDQYGYISFKSNYYWVPGKKRFDVKVLEFCDHLQIYHSREKLAQYSLPPEGTQNKCSAPKANPNPNISQKTARNPLPEKRKFYDQQTL